MAFFNPQIPQAAAGMTTGNTGAGFFGNLFKPFQRATPLPYETAAGGFDPLSGQFADPLAGLGPIDRYKYLNKNQPATIMALAAGLMQGDLAGGFANAGQEMQQAKAWDEKRQLAFAARQEELSNKNLTKEWLLGQGFTEAEVKAAMANPTILSHLLSPPAAAETTDDLKEYNRALTEGFQGTFIDFKLAQIKAGVPQPIGTIPQGYELIETPEGGRQMRPIPGGPADTSTKDVVRQGQADVATRIVTTAAERARVAAKNRMFGGYGQGIIERNPYSDSAEVARQVEVLKSTAKVENLTAMRAASPTGGALGNVTQQESQMLADKSGALDPSSPTFERDLNDYELTLLQVVHGPAEGQRIFEATRPPPEAVPPAGSRKTKNNVIWSTPGG